MKSYLYLLANGQTLTQDQAEGAMHLLMRGEAEPEQAAGLLMGLRARGETLDELTGFTRVMRDYAVKVDAGDPDAIDLCGTGGDAKGTFNISTAASFVCAGAGVTVAKHGNRSVSSQCGSADVLEALGVNVELRKDGVEFCLREVGIAFLFAPHFHPAMRHVMTVRRKLGVRTFFNILGPLCNPAGVRRQLVGAFSLRVAQHMTGILARLGAERVVVVHAEDGLDELSLCDPTTVFEYDAEKAVRPGEHAGHRVRPEDHALDCYPLEALQGGTADDNAVLLRDILEGKTGPHHDVVLLNAAYALSTSGKFDDLDACFDAARESIGSGAARKKLADLAEVSHAAPVAG